MKKDIRALIADGQLTEAAAAAFVFAEKCEAAEAVNALTSISQQMKDARQNWTLGLIAYEEFSRSHARLTMGLTDWLDQLPETPNPSRRARLMDETVFKRRIFRLLVAVKLVVLGYTFYLWKTGGFQNEEAMTTFSSLAPAFVAYISLMLSDFIRQSRADLPSKRRYVSGFLVSLSWYLFPLYALAQMYIVSQKVMGEMSFLQMNAALALTETVIGGYVGRIIEEFFKKE